MSKENYTQQSSLLLSKKKLGKITIYTGCMKAGKSKKLITRINESILEHNGEKPTIITSTIKVGLDQDNLQISSRSGIFSQAIYVDSLDNNLLELISANLLNTDVFIEEGQFFPNLRDFCIDIKQLGCNVFIAALNSQFNLEPWDNVSRLVAVADSIELFKADCEICHEKCIATQSKRISTSKDIIDPSGDYVPCCITCYEM